jgi:pimeloyl-ACP methyl ester carboxylesterase
VRPEPDAFVSVPVPGGELAVARWGKGRACVLAAHGITASSLSWRAVARRLEDTSSTLWAPVGGPFGLARHAHDLLAVADHLTLDRVVLAGHSLGAFVAVLAAAARPGLVDRVVLVDGGLPLPLAVEDVDADALLDATLGPAIQRLDRTFPSVAAYEAFWRQHPAFTQNWNDDVEAYVRYDLAEAAGGGLRSRVVADAVRADGRDLLLGHEPISRALEAIGCPVRLLRAPRGLFNQPPGLQPDELVARWAPHIADFTDGVVNDTNHYSILMGGRGATVVADALRPTP